MRLWNPHSGVLVKTYAGHGYDVRDAAVAADNAKFVSCGGDKQVFLWDVATARFIRKFKGHDGTVNAVRYGANDEVLVTAGYDQCIKVWDCKSRSIDAIQTMRDFKVGLSVHVCVCMSMRMLTAPRICVCRTLCHGTSRGLRCMADSKKIAPS